MTLKPVAMFRCPFRKGKHKIVLCEFLDKERVPGKYSSMSYVSYLGRTMVIFLLANDAFLGFVQYVTPLNRSKYIIHTSV